MKERYFMPCRIIAKEHVEASENLLIEKPLQANVRRDDCAVIQKGGYVLLDFGKELCGGIKITVQMVIGESKYGKMRLAFGESVMEAMSSLGEKNLCNDHSIHNTILDVSSMSNICFGETGFRFLKIEALDRDLHIKGVVAKPSYKEAVYQGSFECNDSLLNQIWETGAYTVNLNMNEFVWDGIKRDRLVWIGDMHPEVATISAVFGNDACVPNSLDFVKNNTPTDRWMNNIATYSMWWILIHHDWYEHFGNYEYLLEQKDYMKEVLQHAVQWVEDGMPLSIENGKPMYNIEHFVDWSSHKTPAELEGTKAVFCLGMDCAARMMESMEEAVLASRCRACAEKLRTEQTYALLNKRVAALMILADIPSKEAKALLAGSSAEEMSCFMGYYVLLAKAKLREYTEALDIIRSYWGGMLQMGATTFWEDFDIRWMENAGRIDEIVPENQKDIHGDFGRFCYTQYRHSLCHGWASGPTAYLSQYVLGVHIIEPGCKKVLIKPQLGDLEWVKGTYPTPYGNISLEHRMENGEIISQIDAPKEIEIVY